MKLTPVSFKSLDLQLDLIGLMTGSVHYIDYIMLTTYLLSYI